MIRAGNLSLPGPRFVRPDAALLQLLAQGITCSETKTDTQGRVGNQIQHTRSFKRWPAYGIERSNTTLDLLVPTALPVTWLPSAFSGQC